MARFRARCMSPIRNCATILAAAALLSALGATRRVVFFCAYGERSAMAVQAAQEAGITSACHIQGGIAAWKDAGGPVEQRLWPQLISTDSEKAFQFISLESFNRQVATIAPQLAP